ncbi:MAG: hypothetical protein IJZ87_02960 [Bacteroidales bacterium]|nr:hypothetical protein [Bacteroidales bacterium]
MNKSEFLIYCLLYAIDLDVNFRKQNLVAIAESLNAVTFVKIYNAIQQHEEKTRREVIEYNKVKHSLTDEEVRSFVETTFQNFKTLKP